MHVSIDISKKALYFILIVIITVSFFIYKYYSFPVEKVERIDIKILNNTKKIDDYLDAILLANNSQEIKNNIKFQELVDSINLKIIDNYSSKLSLTQKESKKVIESYYNTRSTTIRDIHTTMISNKHYNQKREITYEYLNSLNGFAESFSGFACSVASFSYLATIRGAQNNLVKYLAIKPSCEKILTELVNPVTKFLRDRAIVKDMNIVTLNLKKRVKSSVFKLSTAQVKFTFELDNLEKRDYDVLGFKWSKKSELSAHIDATIVAGFDLSSYSMTVEHETRTLTIHLPSPNILTNNVNIYFRKSNKEWGSPKIDSDTYNKISKKAKSKALRMAKDGDLYNEAKKNAYSSVKNIFEPLMKLPQFDYSVEIYFDNDYYEDI